MDYDIGAQVAAYCERRGGVRQKLARTCAKNVSTSMVELRVGEGWGRGKAHSSTYQEHIASTTDRQRRTTDDETAQ